MYYKQYGYKEKQLNKWYHSLIIVLIPLFVICASVNMVTRVSDAYEWKFNKNAEILEEDENADVKSLESANVFLDESQFAEQISGYINGTSDEILTYDKESEFLDYYKSKAAKVSDNDYKRLDVLRIIDTVLLGIAVVSFIYIVFMYLMFVREGYDGKKVLRENLKKSITVFGCFEVVIFMCIGIKGIYKAICEGLLGLEYAKKDLLYSLLGESFPLSIALFTLGISLVIMALIFYIIWVSTKPRDTFNERRYFR